MVSENESFQGIMSIVISLPGATSSLLLSSDPELSIVLSKSCLSHILTFLKHSFEGPHGCQAPPVQNWG